MENLVTPAFWEGKRAFLTGHTGFKGSWLAIWLNELGAQVTGYALPAPTEPNLFEVAEVKKALNSVIGDIRAYDNLATALNAADPQIIFHLAAQPLVSEGYNDPIGTYSTNVIGTINLLEAARSLKNINAIIIITTDKCYENKESTHPYKESDRLGGYDPYSSSKACAELATASYRQSFFGKSDQARLATARAGNVIGGGDWAKNRLVPDILHALSQGKVAHLRNPKAIRPWQHVLEPLAGYLKLAEKLCQDKSTATTWNFGPELADCVSAENVADKLCLLWSETARWQGETTDFPHEAGLLRLDASQAQQMLKWRPRWRLDEALRHTVEWHRAWLEGSRMNAFCRKQINHYTHGKV
jgi:CDP-glucose 4,6-dehydratase